MFLINTLLSAATIGFCAWLVEKKPGLAGFLISMPLSTLLVLFIIQMQYSDDAKGILLAKSISIAIPATLLFFVPFLLANQLKIPFWACYLSGIALLGVSYQLHQFILRLIS